MEDDAAAAAAAAAVAYARFRLLASAQRGARLNETRREAAMKLRNFDASLARALFSALDTRAIGERIKLLKAMRERVDVGALIRFKATKKLTNALAERAERLANCAVCRH